VVTSAVSHDVDESLDGCNGHHVILIVVILLPFLLEGLKCCELARMRELTPNSLMHVNQLLRGLRDVLKGVRPLSGAEELAAIASRFRLAMSAELPSECPPHTHSTSISHPLPGF
jgi:hypothetical protein